MRGLVHHVDLTVRDLALSLPLYDAVLTALGYERAIQTDSYHDWRLVADGVPHSVGIMQASEDGRTRAHDRYAPGLHHLAWVVDSRDEVDRMHELVVRMGATVLDAPADYPQYNRGRGYYAVFFADPDGLKLECVYTPPAG